MKVLMAEDVKRFNNWTVLIYSEPGKGKTSIVKGLEGNTVLFSVDGMYHVLSGVPNVEIIEMDPKKPNDELGDFYRYLIKNIKRIDNIVIDNLSTFQKFWLNAAGKEAKNKTPEQRDYQIIDRVLFDFVASLKALNKNVLLFAHERKVEITRESGGVYTQFQPDFRNLDAIMGIVPIVGRLVIYKEERTIILQPTQMTRAKDQLIGNLKTIGQMELLPKLQNNI